MLGRLLSALTLAAVRGEIAATIQRLKLRIGLTAAAVVLWLLAFVFALVALTAWLTTLVGPIAAAGIIAAVCVVAALGLHLAVRQIARRHPSLATGLSNVMAPLTAAMAEPAASADAAKDAAAGAPPTEEPPSPAALLVLAVVGYILGRGLGRS